MTTRQEAAAKAAEWAQDADRHERTSREEWRQRAHEHALMWTGIAALLPEGPACAVTFPDSMSDDDRARFIAAWTHPQPTAAPEPKPPTDLANVPDFELIPEWRALLDREPEPAPRLLDRTAVHAVIRFVASATGRIDPESIELLTDHCWATCARTSTT